MKGSIDTRWNNSQKLNFLLLLTKAYKMAAETIFQEIILLEIIIVMMVINYH